jgi:hypothetical protein
VNSDNDVNDESDGAGESRGVPVIDAPTAAESATGQVPVIHPPTRDRARDQRQRRSRNRTTARWLTAVGVIAALGAGAALFVEFGSDDPAPVKVSGASTTVRVTTEVPTTPAPSTTAATTTTPTTALPENWIPFPEIPA